MALLIVVFCAFYMFLVACTSQTGKKFSLVLTNDNLDRFVLSVRGRPQVMGPNAQINKKMIILKLPPSCLTFYIHKTKSLRLKHNNTVFDDLGF